MYRSYFWKRGHFLNQYIQSPEWRLWSSWGRHNGERAPRSGKRSHDEPVQGERKQDDWYNTWQKRHMDTVRQFDEFKKLIDEDPYKALFGRRLPETWSENTIRQNRSTSDGSVAASGAGSKKADNDATIPSRPTTESTAPISTAPASGSHADGSEFFIDPITLRKVPVKAKSEGKATVVSTHSARSFDLPVKTFKFVNDASMNSTTIAPEKASKPVQATAQHERPTWLVQEGFSSSEGDKRRRPSNTSPGPRIESALDRYQKKPRTQASEDTEKKARLTYDPKENQEEDVDLLTASDIRASRNRAWKKPRDTAKEKEHQRHVLESNYQNRPRDLVELLEEELAAKKIQTERGLKELRKIAAEQQRQQDALTIAEEQRQRDALRKAHDKEVVAQKAAMEAHEMRQNVESTASFNPQTQEPQQGEGDMATNVHEFVARDRWYKRRAPHANTVAEQKLLQASKDKSLVRELRDIYEDTYGTIDTKHRQPASGPQDDDSKYPSDAYPGTVYEQPWTANVLNDHPDVDSQGALPASQHSQLQSQNEEQKFQALSLIGKLFSEMRENQLLLQEHRAQLLEMKTNNESRNLYQSFKAHEQRIMHNLKAAQNLFKPSSADSRITISGQHVEDLPSQAGPQEGAHAPGAPGSSLDAEDSAPVTIYKILAHDLSSGKVVTTKTANLTEPLAGKAPTISEALLRLENPAKFLPHFAALQNAEYEIAAASPHLLIFKKTRQLKPAAEEKAFSSATAEEGWRYPNPIDGTTTQTGNFASPTGFVNYDPPYPEPEVREQEEAAEAQGKAKDKVRRQEEVFSGSSRRPWHDEYERGVSNKARMKKKHRRAVQRRRTVRRVASEFFRLRLLVQANESQGWE
ncbi:MAG: hypothetical protein Q9191_004674 [Dirinaria sp. TL-2023a]